MDTKEIEKFNSLDLGKFIAATMIIMLHANPFDSISDTLGSVFRSMVSIVAVPYFFTVGGFLFFNKVCNKPHEKWGILKKYVLGLFKLYLIWSVIYFPFVVLDWYYEGIHIKEYIRDFFFEGSYLTLWYLPASIVATTFVFLLFQRFSLRRVFCVSLACYIVGCAFSYYYYVFHKVPLIREIIDIYYSFFKTTKNGVLFGAVFVALGLVIVYYRCQIRKRICIVGCLFSFVFLVGESGILPFFHVQNRSVDLKLFLVPFTFFLVCLLLHVKLPEGISYYWLRKMSTYMFLSQRLFLTAFPMLLPPDSILIRKSWLFFIIVYLSTLLFSNLLYLSINARYKRKSRIHS